MTQTDKTTQPTPGPTLERWDLAEAEDTFRVIRSEGRLIAKVFTMFPHGAPNARLIAAAPKLLALLHRVVEHAERTRGDSRHGLYEDVRALLRDLHGDPS